MDVECFSTTGIKPDSTSTKIRGLMAVLYVCISTPFMEMSNLLDPGNLAVHFCLIAAKSAETSQLHRRPGVIPACLLLDGITTCEFELQGTESIRFDYIYRKAFRVDRTGKRAHCWRKAETFIPPRKDVRSYRINIHMSPRPGEISVRSCFLHSCSLRSANR